MKRKLPQSVTVQIDTREQDPLPFKVLTTFRWFPNPHCEAPHLLQVKTESVKLPEGDYCLKGYGDRCLVERKSGLSELTTNLMTSDYARATASFGRLAAASKNPWLVVEGTLSEFTTPITVKRNIPEPSRVRDALQRVASIYGLQVAFVGRPANRILTAEFVLSLLLNETPWADEFRPGA